MEVGSVAMHESTILQSNGPVCLHRQAVGATVTVWNDVMQEVWMFMKEISSDGDISTVSD